MMNKRIPAKSLKVALLIVAFLLTTIWFQPAIGEQYIAAIIILGHIIG